MAVLELGYTDSCVAMLMAPCSPESSYAFDGEWHLPYEWPSVMILKDR